MPAQVVAFRTTYDAAIEWIKTLDSEVYDHTVHPYCGPAKRRLTEDELVRLVDLVQTHGLPTTLHNLNTSIGMCIYERPVSATYPGIEPRDLQPAHLLTLAAANLPLSEAKKMPDRILWEDGWRVFSTMTHTEGNAELCHSCGLPEPKDAWHYAY